MMSYFGILASFIVLLPLVLGYIALFSFLALSLLFDLPFYFGLHERLTPTKVRRPEVTYAHRLAS